MQLSDPPSSRPQPSPPAEQQPLSERLTQELSSLRTDILDNNLSTVIRDDKKFLLASVPKRTDRAENRPTEFTLYWTRNIY